jgi:pimeloyl-ACP methyl ester carboxylesterase
MNYVEAGQGPLVVLLHGFPEFSYSWRRQIPALAGAGFRVVAPDLRGYNDSPKPPRVEDYRITVVAADVIALIEKLGGSCVLVAHDWGAVVAWIVAMTRPDLLRKLVILNIPHPAPLLRELKRSTKQKLRLTYQLLFQVPLLPELLLPLVLPWVLRNAGRFTADEIREYRNAWKKPGALRGMANYYRAFRKYRREIRPLMRPIEIPTLLIWGEREPVFIRATTEDFDQWVPNLRIVFVAGAGHFVQTDQPEVVNELLLGFV